MKTRAEIERVVTYLLTDNAVTSDSTDRLRHFCRGHPQSICSFLGCMSLKIRPENA